MNILIVTGNPKKENHTLTIANTYKNEVEKQGHTVKVMDLYAPENLIPYFMFDKEKDAQSGGIIERMHQDIMWAHEVVLVHPIWWGLMPAAMKNWVDIVFGPHFAYKYNIDGTEVKMLGGRTAKVFATAGSTAPYYHIPIVREFTPLAVIWRYAILGFCGIHLTEIKVCDKMNVNKGQPPEQRFETFIEKIKYSAKNH